MKSIIALITLIKSILDYKTIKEKRENLKRVKDLIGDLETGAKQGNRHKLKKAYTELVDIGKDGI